MTAFRLPAPLHAGATVGKPIVITHDGRRVDARDTEPIAVSLLAAGDPVLSRSFRFHRPRGLMCSTGQCGWCECRVDDRPGTRSCTVLARQGAEVRSEHSWPTARHDLFGLLDLGSRWVPNTFYHHRFLRPRAFRKLYLDVLRRFGGRGRLTPGGLAAMRARPTLERAIDVAVVGGGPAGMLAAIGAAGGGASVLLLEATEALGGAWRWRTSPPPIDESLTDLIARVQNDPRIEVLTSTPVLGRYGETLGALGADAHWRVVARAVVAATGSYERVPGVPNNDRPGVMGARTVEWLINAFGVVPGRRCAVLAGGADARRVASLLREAGATVDEDLAELRRIEGRDRVRSVVVGGPVRQRRLHSDVLVFDARTPNLDLAISAGAAIESLATGNLAARLDPAGWTTVPGLAMVGACAGRSIEDAGAAAAAEDTGRAAASAPRVAPSSGDGSAPSAPWPAAAPLAQAVHGSAFVCFCEDVRARELVSELRGDGADPETLKRRTAVLTGPCQGKYCLNSYAASVNAGADPRPGWTLPTGRPPLRPVRIADLVRDGSRHGDR
ncbi:MAG: 2Fe-2S iron-sulfur cluster-binding protein [Chloroflexota bacterium]|nr:2Fe-2S iron-sulfur cluster-binding protein [Chloroflexota bacterium]